MRQSRQSVNIWYKFAHLVQFLQNLAWGGSFRPEPLCQISPLSLLKCGLTAPKIAKIANFWYNFAKIYIPLKRFLPNLAWKRESQVRTFMPNFTIVALKIWAYSPQCRQNWYFWYKFAQKGYIPLILMRFLQNLAWGRESEVRILMASFIVVALKMWVYSPKIAINSNSRYKFALRKNSEGRQKKLNICTTTNLLLCNETIIVLKITLLHSVSVITNFVVLKRNKQTDRQKTLHFFVYSQHATYDAHHTWHGDRGDPYHFCTPQLFLIRSVVLPLVAIGNLWENAPTVEKWL